jgi:hypothetical protein
MDIDSSKTDANKPAAVAAQPATSTAAAPTAAAPAPAAAAPTATAPPPATAPAPKPPAPAAPVKKAAAAAATPTAADAKRTTPAPAAAAAPAKATAAAPPATPRAASASGGAAGGGGAADDDPVSRMPGVLAHAELPADWAPLRAWTPFLETKLPNIVQALSEGENATIFNVPVPWAALNVRRRHGKPLPSRSRCCTCALLTPVFHAVPCGGQLLDYPHIIKQPMDLGTVKSKMARHEYATQLALVADIDRIWNNALHYNQQPCQPLKYAQQLQKKWQNRFGHLVKELSDPANAHSAAHQPIPRFPVAPKPPATAPVTTGAAAAAGHSAGGTGGVAPMDVDSAAPTKRGKGRGAAAASAAADSGGGGGGGGGDSKVTPPKKGKKSSASAAAGTKKPESAAAAVNSTELWDTTEPLSPLPTTEAGRSRPDTKLTTAVFEALREIVDMTLFEEPVDREQLPDYYTFIKQPMDLRTVSEKLAEGAYENDEAWANDVRAREACATTATAATARAQRC